MLNYEVNHSLDVKNAYTEYYKQDKLFMSIEINTVV